MNALAGTQAILKCATGRALLAAFLVALTLVGVLTQALAPPLREITGFDPFDVQYPLSRETVAIQMGVYGAAAAQAYGVYAAADTLFVLAYTAFTALLWGWLFNKAPNRMYDLMLRGGAMVLPFLPGAFDLAENAGFVLIVFRVLDLASGVTEITVAAHQAKMFALTVNNAVSVVLVTVTGALRLQAWRSGG